MKLPNRQSIRMKGFDYSTAAAYFVTICCNGAKHRFGTIVTEGDELRVEYNKFGLIAVDEIRSIESRFIGVDVEGFIVMPNHIHIMIINADGGKYQLSEIVGRLKMGISNRCTKLCRQQGEWMEQLWQKNYFERIIRDNHEFDNTLYYMYENPARWQAQH